MNIGNAIFQGIIQGLTEFLPVSSSGHLSLVQYFTGQNGETGALFSILLHMGTLLAVFIAFFSTIWALILEFFSMVADIFRGRFSVKDANPNRRMILLLIVSLAPMVISYLLLDFYDMISSDNDIVVEGICFLITSFLLFASDRCGEGRKNAGTMRYRDALAIGTMQAIAPLPGISRSGSTIATGLFMGLDRKFAVTFSFIMGVPTVLGANLMELKDISQSGLAVPVPSLIAGLAAALIFGLIAIRMVSWLVTSSKFKWFAWYTFALGIATVIIGIAENANGHALQRMITGLLAG